MVVVGSEAKVLWCRRLPGIATSVVAATRGVAERGVCWQASRWDVYLYATDEQIHWSVLAIHTHAPARETVRAHGLARLAPAAAGMCGIAPPIYLGTHAPPSPPHYHTPLSLTPSHFLLHFHICTGSRS